MSDTNEEKIHPGTYVKQHVIPEGMTITKAAELLGVGRPALSNFLNGKAALSSDMALRLESAFGADREYLLNLQAKFTSGGSSTYGQSVITGTHAPALFKIRAHQIENWANQTIAREELAALLRRLVHSTGQNLTLVDFPAYDNSQRHGWDGVVETSTPTPWIPDGKSGWEFGTNQNPRSKAEDDYETRIKSVPPEERIEQTFIFVTPRNWPGKQNWTEEKVALGHWKDVRAYDASDLEQWLEQSASTQIWFAERLGLSDEGYRSLEQCWSKWAAVCEPELSPVIFEPAVEHFSEKFKIWLGNSPDHPFIIAADSRGEALAFLSCLIQHIETNPNRENDRTIVFETPQALQRFNTSNSTPIIAVISNPEVEKESGGLHRRCHCIIVQPRSIRNVVLIEPDIALEPLKAEDFKMAFEKMNYSSDDIERLARESACSPTILRRRLSALPSIKTPEWAGNEEIAQKLLPAVMAGAWHEASKADREIMRLLANTDDYREVENNVTALLDLEDPPLWAIGEYRGVVSRIDALFTIAGYITKSDLENFFLVAEYVLAEKDPTIDLPENEQWMAQVYGKVRDHSDALRRGIRETLILLAVYGNDLYLKRLGFDIAQEVSKLVRSLLHPLDGEKILSHREDFPDYAEAASEEFLSLLEDDLQKPKPFAKELMRSVESSFMVTPPRLGLLKSLKILAWNSHHFLRVVDILAKLHFLGESEAGDNFGDTPESTLQSLFLSWLPQTAASIDERIRALDRLCQRYSALGWVICMKQLDWRLSSASPNPRPLWRDHAKNAGYEVSNAERQQFIQKTLNLVLAWPQHDEKTLADLIQRIGDFSNETQQKIWDIINRWANETTSEDAKAFLRQRIHGCARGRRLRKIEIAHPEREREASRTLLPKDLLIRHAWLFKSQWVELPPDETEEEDYSYEKNRQRLYELRLDALREIWEARGFSGVTALLEKIKAEANIVGSTMKEILKVQSEKIGFVKSCIDAVTEDNESFYKACLAGFLWSVDTDLIETLVDEIERSYDQEALTMLLLCLPYTAATWHCLDEKPGAIKTEYWKNVEPRTWVDTPAEEINETIDRLLEVNRAPEAFGAVCMMLDKVETSRLIQLLTALPSCPPEEIYKNVLGGDFGYYISKAFDVLDERPNVPADEKARLEFACLPWLEGSEHGVPNLEEQITQSPNLYAYAIVYAFKRNDELEDPPEFRAGSPEERNMLVSNANNLLSNIKRIPGSDEQGNIDSEALMNWLGDVRALCKQYGRAEVGDLMIGQLLAGGHISKSDYSTWPCRPVCEALEWMSSSEVSNGFITGTRNSRGSYWKGEGGAQERDLAARYREWSKKLAYEFPYVGRILESIARSYDDQAGWEDNESNLRRRLPFR